MASDRWLAAARSAGITRRDLERYAALELIDLGAEIEGEIVDLEARLRRIRRLQRHVDLPLEAVEIIIRLRERLDAIEPAPPRVTVRIIDQAQRGH